MCDDEDDYPVWPEPKVVATYSCFPVAKLENASSYEERLENGDCEDE